MLPTVVVCSDTVPAGNWVCNIAVCSILARPNGPALDTQRSQIAQTAFVVRGAYFRPGNDARMRARATPRPHAPLRGASAPGVQTGKS